NTSPLLGDSVARLAWHATACGSLEALRRRLSPGLPLSRSPSRGVRSYRTTIVLLPQKRNDHQRLESSRVAGGRADMRPLVALVPLALRHRLSAGLLLLRTVQTDAIKQQSIRAPATKWRSGLVISIAPWGERRTRDKPPPRIGVETLP